MCSMQPKWVIENFEPDNKFGPLADECRRQGCDVEVITYTPFQAGSYDIFEENDCVLFQGSINLAQQLQREKRWIPGPWLTAKNYECTRYYAHLGKYLFNWEYIMLPRADVPRKLDWLYDKCFVREELFFRPSSGLKPWTAGVYCKPNISSLWGWVEEFTEPDSMVVISTCKKIDGEWRFVCAEGKVITGCQYERDGKLSFQEGYDPKAKELADTVAAEAYKPDPMYIVDICLSGGNYYLMEINSFSCGGLYALDLVPIVETANRLAVKEWEECQK